MIPLHSRKVFLLILVLAIGVWAEAAEKAPQPKKAFSATDFLRLRRDAKNQPVALETAIVRYVPQAAGKTSPSVALIAAVHIADKSYYEQINKEFQKYDVVLYELVAPPGTQVPKGGTKTRNPVSAIQKGLKKLLDLEFQLDAVDYTRKNLVHADMSPEQISKTMARRGESYWTLFSRILGYAFSQEAQSNAAGADAKLLFALFSKDRSLALKRIMAEQFHDIGGTIMALEGPKGSTLLSGRNQIALAVLRQQIAKGKRKIAIFYGGAHMPDFDKRLRKDFGLAPKETRWLTAWDLQEKPQKAAPQKSQK